VSIRLGFIPLVQKLFIYYVTADRNATTECWWLICSKNLVDGTRQGGKRKNHVLGQNQYCLQHQTYYFTGRLAMANNIQIPFMTVQYVDHNYVMRQIRIAVHAKASL